MDKDSDEVNQLCFHSEVYKWVSEEREIELMEQNEYSLRDVREREAEQFNAKLSYNQGDFKWTKSNKTGEWLLVVNTNRLKADNRKSSYLSWILEEDAPFSDETRIYSLPIYEENFWNRMVDEKKGYLRLYSKGENEIELRKMESEMKENLKKFRDNICLALLFINICFFVLNVTLKDNKELKGIPLNIPISLLSYGNYEDFLEWQRNDLVIGGVSEEVLIAFNTNLTCQDVNITDIKILATNLLLEEEYKMKCVDYFRDLTPDCTGIML